MLWGGAVAALLVVLALTLLLGRMLAAPQLAATPTTTTPRWKEFSPLPQPRAFFALSTFNRQLYAIGGRSGNSVSGSVERYNPDVDAWVQLSPKPTAVQHIQSVVIAGKIYVPGGELADGSVSRVFEAYDPSRDNWEKLPDLPEGRSRYAIASFEGKLYLFGGWDGSNVQAQVWRYDPDTRQWDTRLDPMPTPRRSATASIVESRVYVVGGEGERGPLSVNERFDPSLPSGNSQNWATAAPLPQQLAAPSSAGSANTLVVFDPSLGKGLQYFPISDKWLAFPLAKTGGVSLQATPLDNNVFLIQSGSADLNALIAYPVYTVSLPIIP